MIQVRVSTSTERKTVNAEITATPREIFDDNGISTEGATINLRGDQLSVGDLNTPFADLGVKDGDSVSLTAIVKTNCA